MHPTDYTNAARDMIAIRDRFPPTGLYSKMNPWRDIERAVRAATIAAASCADEALEHVDDTGPWACSGSECVTWVEVDSCFVPSHNGGLNWQAAPVTHIRIDWRDREDRHDDRKTFHLRVDSRENFDSDFAAMIAELRGSP